MCIARSFPVPYFLKFSPNREVLDYYVHWICRQKESHIYCFTAAPLPAWVTVGRTCISINSKFKGNIKTIYVTNLLIPVVTVRVIKCC